MSEELAPKKKATRKKKAAAPKVEVQETVVAQTPKAEVKILRYKCIECGNEQGVKRCLRCGGHIVREV